ncbi:hypothetical protein V3C99_003321, partial [Haemonchus contortus]
ICYVEESQREKEAMHRCRNFSTIKWRCMDGCGTVPEVMLGQVRCAFIERDRKDGYIPGEFVKLLKLISQLQRRSASG